MDASKGKRDPQRASNVPQSTSVRWLPASELENPQGENLRLESGVSVAPLQSEIVIRIQHSMFDIFFTSILRAFYPILTSGSLYPVPVWPDRCEEDSLYSVPVSCCGLRNHSNAYRTEGSRVIFFTRSCRTTDLPAISVGSWPIGAGT